MKKIKKYTDWVKRQECCHCHAPADDPHHCIGFGDGYMGGKAHDLFAVPLCRNCHEFIHREFAYCPAEWVAAQFKWLHTTLKKAVEEGVICVK